MRFKTICHGTDAPAVDSHAITDAFFPAVRDWWRSRFSGFSLPQQLAIPSISQDQHTLVCAPTGTGKTLCAFISIISDLFARHAAGTLTDTIDTVYISPLRALGTDITKNLLAPLQQISALINPPAAPIENQPSKIENTILRVAQRTGDTTRQERARLIRRPPHILVTTPESLALCLASGNMRQHLKRVRRIIIDELHSLAPNKRGSDLMLSMERLAHFVTSHGQRDPQRIGLSATIAPLDRMAEFLTGSDQAGRDCTIVDASFHRPLELDIASVFGNTPFQTTANINRQVYDFLETVIRQHRTTLIFTNTRAATERVTFALRKRFADGRGTRGSPRPAPPLAPVPEILAPEHIAAHHSSLDRDVRLDIERRLKLGELRAVVCSTSLELGIDIGTIDRVILLNSPKGVARGLQRVGRSGHSLEATAIGTFIPTVPADLLEAIVTADAMRKRHLSEIDFPRNCLDVLAQHLIGMTLQAVPEGLDPDEAYQLIRRTAAYAALSREQFDAVVRYLSTHDLADAANVTAKLWFETIGGGPVEGFVGSPSEYQPSKGKRLHPLRRSLAALYAQNVGTITQEGQVKVRLQKADEKAGVIGAIEEAFAQILKPMDRFVLAGRCVQVVGSKAMTIDVVDSQGQTPTVPRWYSGLMSMEHGLAARMREFRGKVRAIAPAGASAMARMLMRQYSVSESTARAAAEFMHAQYRYADIPCSSEGLLVERVPDEPADPVAQPATVLVFHTMQGRAANDALARAVAYRLATRFRTTLPARHEGRSSFEARTAATSAAVVVDDYAFGIWIESTTAAKRADRTLIRSLLSPAGFEEDLAAAVEAGDLFRAQFRFTAVRAHAILQNKFGRRRYIGQMQGYATRLYEALKETAPDHMLLTETRRTVMNDLLCAPAAREYLEALAGTAIRVMDLPAPSPFAFGLFAAGAGRRDSLQLADTADFLLAMYQQVQRRLKAVAPTEPETLFS